MKRHCVSVQIGEEERIKEWRCQRDVCSQREEKKKEKEKKNKLFSAQLCLRPRRTNDQAEMALSSLMASLITALLWFCFVFFSFLSSFHFIRNNFKKFWVGFLSSTSFICFVVVRLPLHDFQVFSEKKKDEP